MKNKEGNGCKKYGVHGKFYDKLPRSAKDQEKDGDTLCLHSYMAAFT